MRPAALAVLAAAATLAMTSSPSVACPQSMVDQLAERTEHEVARDILRDYPVVGLYLLTRVESEIYSFELVDPLAVNAPATFSTESFMSVSCSYGFNHWWDEDRAIGDRVLVVGDILEQGGFRASHLYVPDSPEAVVLQNAIARSPEDAE